MSKTFFFKPTLSTLFEDDLYRAHILLFRENFLHFIAKAVKL